MTALFRPTLEQRKTVRAMAAYGIPQADIARVIEIAEHTLRKHFREELDKAAIEATAKVAETCFAMATSGTQPAATFFWLKCRGGWRELPAQHEHTHHVSQLTDEQIQHELDAIDAREQTAAKAREVAESLQAKPTDVVH